MKLSKWPRSSVGPLRAALTLEFHRTRPPKSRPPTRLRRRLRARHGRDAGYEKRKAERGYPLRGRDQRPRSQESSIVVTANVTPVTTVRRSRFRSTMVEPLIAEEPPMPPKRSDMPAPLPEI